MWFVGILRSWRFLLELWERPPGAGPAWDRGVPSWKSEIILTKISFSGTPQQLLCFPPGDDGTSLGFCGILE